MRPKNALPMYDLLRLSFLGGLLLLGIDLQSQIIEVGPGKPYSSISQAAQVAGPGDTILVAPGTYPGGEFVGNLQGSPGQWITLRGDGIDPVTIQGGTNAIQFSDPAWLVIENFRFRNQTGNGLNMDDGGTYDSPAKHIHVRDCIFEDISATGNNDLFKMSGVDSFIVEQCQFRNGAAGGSGIDMVGCHWGNIRKNHFENLGSNSVQAKGGTRYISIYQNYFKQGGQRTLNLGGSTGAAFFRPLGVNYEAADLEVYSNIIISSWAPIAYVGSQRVRVWNNTIYQPQNWVIRILQESSDTSFYQAAAYGEFVNNIIVVTSSLSTTVNVGPFTNASSFLFANNLWYHQQNPNWQGPTLPAPQSNSLIQVDPEFNNPNGDDFSLEISSPAIGSGRNVPNPQWLDYDGFPFLQPPSMGAIEGGEPNSFSTNLPGPILQLFPNPSQSILHYNGPEFQKGVIYNLHGINVMEWQPGKATLSIASLPSGSYWLTLEFANGKIESLPFLRHTGH